MKNDGVKQNHVSQRTDDSPPEIQKYLKIKKEDEIL